MGAKRVESLIVWQLADQIRARVYAITATGRPANDRTFCDQIRNAARSAPSNIAEGFGRYRHREFAQFVNIARGSMFEVLDLLRDGVLRQHWTPDAIDESVALCNRAIAAATHLIRYLKSTPNPN